MIELSISNIANNSNKLDSPCKSKHLASDKVALKPDPSTQAPIDDTISISEEAKALFAKDKKKKFLGINNYTQEELDAMLEQLRNSKDDTNNPMKIQLQCLKIAMRIISGDNVPIKDRAFLAEHEPAMYGRATLLRRQKDDPKDHKSILDDEKIEKPDGTFSPTAPLASDSAGEIVADF